MDSHGFAHRSIAQKLSQSPSSPAEAVALLPLGADGAAVAATGRCNCGRLSSIAAGAVFWGAGRGAAVVLCDA
jgi:hypothetical protein